MSPAAVLERDEARAVTLEAADSLFYARGVNAVTMAEVRDKSGVSLRRLYAMYPSKSNLVTSWLEHRHAAWMEDHISRVDSRLAAGADPIDATFDALAAWMTESNFRGCGFINTNAELHDLTEQQRIIIQRHKTAIADHLDNLVPNGRAIAVLIDGAIVQASMFESTAPVELARVAAHTIADGGSVVSSQQVRCG